MALTEYVLDLRDLDQPRVYVTPPLPEGHAVGLRQWQAEDVGREDHSTGTRKFMVSLWYPAEPDPQAPPARITDILEPHRLEAFALLTKEATDADRGAFIEAASQLTTRAQCRLPVLHGEKRPVLIYYPGGQGHRMTNSGLCEQLAARGYVVLALDAPRDAPVVVFPDGQIVTQPLGDEDYIWPRVADVRCLLDDLAALNQTLFGGDLDLNLIGMFGSSRGGYLSTICSVQDSRIKAAINMDGFTWGLWVNEGTGLQKFPGEFQRAAKTRRTPLLRLMGDQGGIDETRAIFDKERPETSGDFLLASVHGWQHSDFGLTSFLSGDIKDLYKKPFTTAAPERFELLLDTIADFFDSYVRGTAARPKLAESTNPAMDVCFQPATAH